MPKFRFFHVYQCDQLWNGAVNWECVEKTTYNIWQANSLNSIFPLISRQLILKFFSKLELLRGRNIHVCENTCTNRFFLFSNSCHNFNIASYIQIPYYNNTYNLVVHILAIFSLAHKTQDFYLLYGKYTYIR